MRWSYYNEIDRFASAWLRELIKRGLIADGEVDERPIQNVSPDDVAEYRQCHFFAGIGVWSYALRQGGWSDDRPVWTGSCPCQPFSAAGKRKSHEDDRHLWPVWFNLIKECRPVAVLGEQVGSRDGLAWLDAVSSDLERENYAIGAVDIPACGFGAPHIRSRLYFAGVLAKSKSIRREIARTESRYPSEPSSPTGELADNDEGGRQIVCAPRLHDPRPSGDYIAGCGNIGIVADYGIEGCEGRIPRRANSPREDSDGDLGSNSPTNGFWADAEWIPCRDGKLRSIEPGTFPLAHGSAARVGRLRGYGNAIVAPVAEAFIRAVMDIHGD